MKISRLVAVPLALLALTSAAPGQEDGRRAEPAVPPQVVEPAARRRLVLPVSGLTPANESDVMARLEALETVIHRCPECMAEFRHPGECPKCKKALVTTRETVLDEIRTDTNRQQVVVESREGMEMRLSLLEGALRAESVVVEEGQLLIGDQATLVVSAATTAEEARAIQRALAAAGLFESALALVSPSGVVVHVTGGATPVRLERVREVLAGVRATYEVTDLIWDDWCPIT